MNKLDLEKFIDEFFTAYQCEVTKEPGILKVQLTEEMDRALMNRPFYWHYMKSTGQKGVPMELTLITDVDKQGVKGEWLDIGSPRVQQIFNYITDNEKYVMLFQEIQTTKHIPLYPWLLTNIKVSYKGKLKKEELISLGIQLISGKIVVNMMDELHKLSLKQQISDLCYTMSPIITIPSGYKRIEKVILNYIENQPKDWADEARKTLAEEIALLNQFYQEDQDDDLYLKEVEELQERYTPEINLEVVSGGLVYLHDTFAS